jgi:pimeloyl-ACP methyl ester carboxylesterase
MGGFLALEVAKQYPELVESVNVTGAIPLEGWHRSLAGSPLMLYLEYGLVSFIKLCPDWLYSRICSWMGAESHDELRIQTTKNFDLDLLKQGYTAMLNFTAEDMAMIRVRTLLVAASALDNAVATRRMGQLLQDKNPDSRAVVVKGYVHAWNLRFPQLFAQTVTAWVENTELPNGLQQLV